MENYRKYITKKLYEQANVWYKTSPDTVFNGAEKISKGEDTYEIISKNAIKSSNVLLKGYNEDRGNWSIVQYQDGTIIAHTEVEDMILRSKDLNSAKDELISKYGWMSFE